MSNSLHVGLYLVEIVADCANAQNRVQDCPKPIPLIESIGEVNRRGFRQAIQRWLVG